MSESDADSYWGKDNRVIVGVPKESYPGERRVALVPAVIPTLAKAGLEVVVESGAGAQAGYADSAYVEKGGKILPDRAAVFAAADVIVQVLCYGSNDLTGKADLPLLRRDQLLDRLSASVWFCRSDPADCRRWRQLIFRRTCSPHHARTEHGRAFLYGDDLRIQSGAARR